MKLNFKQIWVLAAMLLASLSVSAADFEVDGIYYNITSIENRECGVAAKEGGYEGAIEIPSKVTYSGQDLTVVAIEHQAFKDCTQLTKITLNEGIQSIGQYAFSGCTNLTEIILPNNSLKEIGTSAFSECNGITKFTIPNSVTTVYDRPFWGCSSLETLIVGGGVNSIATNLCQGCDKLNELYFLSSNNKEPLDLSILESESLKKLVIYRNIDARFRVPNIKEIYCDCDTIYNNMFNYYACKSLETVKLVNVKTIGNNAFADSGIASLTLPNSLQKIGLDAFRNCTKIETLLLPDSVIEIGGGAFRGCTGIKTLNIPDLITDISKCSVSYGTYQTYYHGNFEGCTGLKYVTIGKNVLYMGSCFSGCDSIENINIRAIRPPECDLVFSNKTYLNANLCIPIDTKETYSGTSPWSNFFNITEKEELTSQFKYEDIWYERDLNSNTCHAISTKDETEYAGNVEIPDSAIFLDKKYCVTAIESSAFSGCKLTNVSIPKNCKIIGDSAFYACTLVYVNIGGCTEIGAKAFCSCSKLESVDIDVCGKIGSRAFAYCNALNTVNIGSCDEIGNSAFAYCNALNTVNIGSCDEIDDRAFYSCDSLRTVNIASCGEIGAMAFYNNSELNTIKIGTCNEIGGYAFDSCYDLESISIPGNCIFIGNGAFNNCYSLKTVTFEDGKEPLVLGCNSRAHVGSSVTPFPNPTTVDESRTGFRNGYYDGLFYDAQRIETLIINRNIKLNQYYGREIGSTSGSSYSTVYNDMIYYSPFYGLKNLKKVVIGENVTQICENTIQAVVSAQETTMEYKNFGECDNISIVISEAPVAPIGGGFSDDVYANANLYLTNGGEDSYRNDEYWKRFVNISDLIQATAIEIVPSQLKIDCNDTYQLDFSILPKDASLKTLQWQSSDENIVTVDGNGLVTSYDNFGTVEITATACDGSNITASCTITVVEKSGIGHIEADGKVDVRAANGNIYIINKPTGENCYVYNIGGTLVSVTINDTIYSLEKGVYVVRIGTFVKKVIL